MAEVKNAFIKSKMNKDLDARLLPSGEYRNAINAQVSRSEGADVGALENILGNKSLVDFEPSISNLTSIGYVVDEINSDIYIFLTDNATSTFVTTGVGSNHFIYKYNTSNSISTKILEGPFLNFSKLFPIFGVNLLEQLLFWTDNRNQPRKISVNQNLGYYTTEDQISVAKYNPYEAIALWEESAEAGSGTYETTMKDVVNRTLPEGGSCDSVAISALSTFPITDLDINTRAGITGASVPAPLVGMTIGILNPDGTIAVLGETVISYTSATDTTGSLTISGVITLANPSTLILNPNPYYDPSYNGDPNFLTDKFVRFSYRFRFDDGEYSLMAPFTQPCFIPEQDGYFMNTEEEVGDQQLTFNSTIVGFMENKVNKINLKIPLPATQTELTAIETSPYKITELDVLYKESDGLAIQVLQSLPTVNMDPLGSNIYNYEYQAQKPYKSLPPRETTRVYDKIPVKAFSQEIISNRVVYGNFQDKHTPPAFLNYNVNVTEKASFDLQTGSATQNGALVNSTTINLSTPSGTIIPGSLISGPGIPPLTVVTVTTGNPITQIEVSLTATSVAGAVFVFTPAAPDQNTTSIIEYPTSGVKTNRNYQIGVILSDKFGRQSTTILSSNKSAINIGSQTYIGSTLYSPFIDSGTDPYAWPGNSLKVLFNEAIPPDPRVSDNYPGVYNGDPLDPNYNPLGWYSYKIVVKQQEQEYYNVYTAGALKGSPTDITLNLSTSAVVLINDNINKVPRDLNEVGPQDRSFRSSVQLFGRVENDTVLYSNVGNRQFYPPKRAFTTNTIEDLFDLYDVQESLVTTATCYSYELAGAVAGEGVLYTNCVGEVITWSWTIGQIETTVCAQENSLTAINGGTFVRGVACSTAIPITTTDNPFHVFFRAESDPFLALITTSQTSTEQFGVSNVSVKPYETIENLTIFETEPFVSKLDIFWETSTAGLIVDLNNLILNEGGGSAGFSSFNSTNFTEEAGGNNKDVLSADFTLVDNFGGNIPPIDIANPGLTINSVFNTTANPVDNSSWFTLVVDPLNPKFWNIEITNDFLTNSFFGSNSGERIWDFDFTAELTNGTTSTFTKQVSLGNEVPVLYNNETGSGTALVPDAGISPNPLINVTHDINDSVVDYDLSATNGAFNGIPIPKNSNRGEELSWSVSAVKASDNASVAYFSITTKSTSTSEYSIAQLNFDTSASAPSVTYEVTITAQDANFDEAVVMLTINMGVTPVSVQDCLWQCVQQGESQADQFRFTLIEISGNGATTSQNGWYIFADDWASVALGGNVIQIDQSGAFTGAQGTTCNPNGLQWMYATTESAVINLFIGSSSIAGCGACGNGDGFEFLGTLNGTTYRDSVDTTGESFEII